VQIYPNDQNEKDVRNNALLLVAILAGVFFVAVFAVAFLLGPKP
jgi:hypothetical protein